MNKLKSVLWGYDIRLMEGHYDDYEKIYVVGDIHGRYDRLKSVMSKFQAEENDLIIFLGDYVDIGPDSALCLEFIKNLEEKANVVALMGECEYDLVKYFEQYGMEGLEEAFADDYLNPQWLPYGNQETVKSLYQYGQSGKDRIALLEWVANLPFGLHLDNNTFCHAGINLESELPLFYLKGELHDEICIEGHEFYDFYDGEYKWYIGHTPVPKLPFNDSKEPVPVSRNNIVFMDTGSYMDKGRISCIEIKSGTLYQSDD